MFNNISNLKKSYYNAEDYVIRFLKLFWIIKDISMFRMNYVALVKKV